MRRSAICCPRCGAIESAASAVCHRCGFSFARPANVDAVAKNFRSPDFFVKALKVSFGVHFAATLVYALFTGGTLLEAILPGDAFWKGLYALGALSDRAIMVDGEWWRLLTATFAHGGLIHLFFNTMALGAVGPETERNLGNGKFLLIYIAAAILSNLASLTWHVWIIPEPFFQVGASGAICGLMGALFSIAKMRGGVYEQVVSRTVRGWIVMTVIFGFLVPGIDNVAHISGMVIGAAITRSIGLKRLR
jgi:rhomboid protease GluP